MSVLRFPVPMTADDAEGLVDETNRKIECVYAALEHRLSDRRRDVLRRELARLEAERIEAERIRDHVRAS